ncbi:hypothetical protein MTP99_013020 [Tenebrio molitor]|nr:hypothetical protein MTP99_013020 [Tenebrio molitor]CAH1371579.1 unnamed protein product [Tenebrio molitor]
MFPRISISVIVVAALLIKYTQGYCIPCPREGITLSSFTDCDCPLSKFYDTATKSCVHYVQCPLPPLRNPLPELKALVPTVHDLFSNTIDAFKPEKVYMPKDVTLTVKAMQKRLEEVKRNLPGLMGPIIGTVALKNRDLFEACKGNIGCVIRGALKRENNYDLIFPKLKPVLNEVIKIFHGVFDDLKEMAEESCRAGPDRCPLIKGLLHYKEIVPENLEEVMDLMQIAKQINKYFIKDLEKHLEKINSHN